MNAIRGLCVVMCAAAAGTGHAGETIRISPEGHLKEFLSRQVTGLTGHRSAMGYPFDGCMWAGSISNVYFEEDLPYSRRIAAPRDEIWWPYEQAAYFLDGEMRLSRLVDAPDLREDFKRNLDWCLAHAVPDGDLFAAYSKSRCQWPMVIFFRAALAYADETGDARVRAAFIRHYAAKKNGFHHPYDRDVLSLEGLLKVSEWTGDKSYVDLAETWFLSHEYYRQFSTSDRVHSHGVTFCEMLKLPMLLYKATGKESWRALAIKAMRDVFRQNEMPNGEVSACEYLSGRDPWEGSETCVSADMLCSLAHFLDDPEVGCEAADHMEKITYNALPGAMTKDFRAHQYISLPNQAVATPFSHGGHFFYGEPDWNRFRVCHFAQCCSGNINRAMPLFVENMWRVGVLGMSDTSCLGGALAAAGRAGDRRRGRRRDGEDADHPPSGAAVCAMLLGPGRMKGEGYEIVCETKYPFGDKMVYRFKGGALGDRVLPGGDDVGDGRRSPSAPPSFSFRVPSWVASATVSKNGTPINLAVCPGTLATVPGPWRDGDTLEVVFEQPVILHSDRQWHWLTRGALTLSHPVKTRCIREKRNAAFSDLSFEDPEPFNYAFAAASCGEAASRRLKQGEAASRRLKEDEYSFFEKRRDAASLGVDGASSPYPFETPSFIVRVPMREIREWSGLAEQRFTPSVPLYTHETGRMVTLDFVPYATTLTRITAFPDTVRREPLPIVRAYVSPKSYAYDPRKPLALQQYEPETWSDTDFMDKADVIQRSPDLWSDLEAHFHAIDNKLAYLLFRFWSDREGTVTCALGASRCVQAFFEGREVYSNGPIVEGRMVAPFWFDVKARKGYNYLKVKVACGLGKEVVFGQDQYRREWGAKLDVFRVGETQTDGEQARLEPVARRVLADFSRVEGLEGFR